MPDISTPTRRGALAQLAAVTAALAVLTRARAAQASADAGAISDAGYADDTVLNALLQIELDAVTAYGVFAGIVQGAEDAGAVDAGGDPNAAIAPVVHALTLHFQSQHQDHADALTALIQSTNGLPIASSSFALPTGFKPSVINVVRLACNAERAAAIAYVQAVKGLGAAASARLAAAIGGVETQHFVVLYSLALGLLEGNATSVANAAKIVPQSFVASVGSGTSGLEAVSPFAFS